MTRSFGPFVRALTIGASVGIFLLGNQAAVAQESLQGAYRLHDGPDVASELVLKPDGTFQYFLYAGSLDEHAEGTWKVEGTRLKLTTLPRPIAAVFSPGAISSASDGPLVLHVTDPSGNGIAGVYFTIGFDRGEPLEDYTQDYGWTLDGSETRSPRWIEFSVPGYDLRSPRFPIELAAGHNFSYILTPNDLGTIDFDGIEIDVEPNRLNMHRFGAVVTYDRERSGSR